MNPSPDDSLAIVVALTNPAPPHLAEGLARFGEEAGPLGEVLLLDASGSAEGARLASRFANVRIIPKPSGRLAPSLWRDGLLATGAKLVALTTAQMIPRRGWIEALKARMRQTGAAGVGGPIAPGPGLGATDRAVALLRYANYFPLDPSVSGDTTAPPTPTLPRKGGGSQIRSIAGGAREIGEGRHLPRLWSPSALAPSPLAGEGWGGGVSERGEDSEHHKDLPRIEPPGDNALYCRDRLMAVESSWLDGFWEVEVHQALRERGESLAMADGAVVNFLGGVGLASMASQRFRHARRYALGRSAGFGAMARLARVGATPLVPPLLCLRALNALRARKMPIVPGLSALPAMAWLSSAWAVGEAVGTWPDDRTRGRLTRRIKGGRMTDADGNGKAMGLLVVGTGYLGRSGRRRPCGSEGSGSWP